MRRLAHRVKMLEAEITELDAALLRLVRRAAPRTLTLCAIGVDHAGPLHVTANRATRPGYARDS
jgi:hypothetical protein